MATEASATINSGGDKDDEISVTERPTIGIDISNDINTSINGDNGDSSNGIASQEPTTAQEKKDCSASDIGNGSMLAAAATTTFGSLPFSITAAVSDAKHPAENDNDVCNYADNNNNDRNSRDADGNNAGRETIVVAAAASSSTPLMAFSEVRMDKERFSIYRTRQAKGQEYCEPNVGHPDNFLLCFSMDITDNDAKTRRLLISY